MIVKQGMVFRAERRRQHLTLRQLSEKTGIDYSMLSKYENGTVEPPEEKRRMIESALNMTENDILMSSLTGSAGLEISHRTADGKLMVKHGGEQYELTDEAFKEIKEDLSLYLEFLLEKRVMKCL